MAWLSGDSHLLGSKSSSAKMGRDVPGSTLARSKSSRNKVQSSAGSKSGKSARRRQGDFVSINIQILLKMGWEEL